VGNAYGPTAYVRTGAAGRAGCAVTSQDDVYLVRAAQEGSADAFSALVDKYHSKVFGIV